MKREDYISWEEYFMGLALLSAKRSKDPKTQVGACIIDNNKKIISVGYNGAPTGFDDELIPWSTDEKHLYVCHAEINAILNSKFPVKDCTLFCTLFPCNECAKMIIQAGIKEVIYLNEKDNEATRRMFNICGIKYRKYRG